MPRSTFLSGKDAVFRYFQDGSEITPLSADSWECNPSVTKFRDGVNGETRDRTGSQVDFYELQAECFVDTLNQADAIIADQSNEDARLQPLDKSIMLQIFPRDGSQKAYAFTDVVLEDWKINQSGRKNRIKLTLMYSAGNFQQLSTL